MIAYAPGRRRTARSFLKKWSFPVLAAITIVFAITAGSVFAYNARPARQVIVIMPTAVPTSTPFVYRPTGPDRSLPAMYDTAVRITLGPRTALPAILHLGPSRDYVVLGTLQAGAALEVVGRDDSGEWLAVVFPPNSTFRAWLPAAAALEVEDIEALPVEPVRFLP